MSAREDLTLPPKPYLPLSLAGSISAMLCAAFFTEAAWRDVVEQKACNPLPVALTGMACLLGIGLLFALVYVKRRTPQHISPPQSAHAGPDCPQLSRSAEAVHEAATVVPDALHCQRPRAGCVWIRLCYWMLAGAAIASVSSALWMHHTAQALDELEHLSASELTFITEGDPQPSSRGMRMRARIMYNEQEIGAAVLLHDAAVEAGSTIQGTGRLKRLEDTPWARSRFMRGELVVVDLIAPHVRTTSHLSLISKARTRMLEVIQPDRSQGRALLAAVICGRTTERAQTDLGRNLADAGLAHLAAVSGSHLAIIATLTSGFITRLSHRRWLRALLLILLLLIYASMTGSAPSAMRSLAMVGAASLASLGGRRSHTLSGLALASLVLIGLHPATVHDLAFQLSVASVLGIALGYSYLAYMLESIRIPRFLARSLACSLAALIASAPIAIPAFGRISLISPLANLIAAPLMAVMLGLGMVFIPLAAAIAPLCSLVEIPAALANGLAVLASVLASLPFASIGLKLNASIMVVTFGLLALAWWQWRARPRMFAYVSIAILVVLPLCILVHQRFFAPASVVVLDVGQGDAILVRDGSVAILVDAGVDQACARALARQGVLHLDAVFITHWDKDHWGGLPELLRGVVVDRVVVPKGAAELAPQELVERLPCSIEEVSLDDRIHVGSFVCRVVWPRERVQRAGNDESLCLDVTYENDETSLRVLLTGDVELEQERVFSEDIGDIDVLKVGHHGSKASLDLDLLEELTCEVAVASAGAKNRYGHPSQACQDAVEAYGALFFCTIDSGDIELFPGAAGVRVRTSRGDLTSLVRYHTRHVQPSAHARLTGKARPTPMLIAQMTRCRISPHQNVRLRGFVGVDHL
ncbi:DNA internalization-related competence protein ComEC/Rec2 [Collinsella sp. AGMB00827]|uniref:DNA internalization-related competence protein ComEC/Rec2 n=1 Tax=Collinsella ureilytica TaxID=2869515 RepID=A0ABS7MLJ7_9ACTN|nr:DNA internalization-related competence protein ComEC/Rec2 [Collinsella urealyticum]MBY4797965.1 DNA internalization-related competence protein ComEC/Rec2 [Collinsella urealyticum]